MPSNGGAAHAAVYLSLPEVAGLTDPGKCAAGLMSLAADAAASGDPSLAVDIQRVAIAKLTALDGMDTLEPQAREVIEANLLETIATTPFGVQRLIDMLPNGTDGSQPGRPITQREQLVLEVMARCTSFPTSQIGTGNYQAAWEFFKSTSLNREFPCSAVRSEALRQVLGVLAEGRVQNEWSTATLVGIRDAYLSGRGGIILDQALENTALVGHGGELRGVVGLMRGLSAHGMASDAQAVSEKAFPVYRAAASELASILASSASKHPAPWSCSRQAALATAQALRVEPPPAAHRQAVMSALAFRLANSPTPLAGNAVDLLGQWTGDQAPYKGTGLGSSEVHVDKTCAANVLSALMHDSELGTEFGLARLRETLRLDPALASLAVAQLPGLSLPNQAFGDVLATIARARTEWADRVLEAPDKDQHVEKLGELRRDVAEMAMMLKTRPGNLREFQDLIGSVLSISNLSPGGMLVAEPLRAACLERAAQGYRAGRDKGALDGIATTLQLHALRVNSSGELVPAATTFEGRYGGALGKLRGMLDNSRLKRALRALEV